MELLRYLSENNLTIPTLETSDHLRVNTSQDGKLISVEYVSWNKSKEYISSPEIVESRGLVFEKETGKLVSRMFDRFFNYDEPVAEDTIRKFNWDDYYAFFKEDGSLIGMYFYDGNWCVCTSGTPDASGELGSKTFHDKFWEVFNTAGLNTDSFNKNVVYIWELITPELNMSPVPRTYIKILGARNMVTLKEISYKELETMFTNLGNTSVILKYYHNPTEPEIKDLIKDMASHEEGFVLCDNNFNRLKMKNKDWSNRKKEDYTSIYDLDLIGLYLSGEYRDLVRTRPSVYQKPFEGIEELVELVKIDHNTISFALMDNPNKLDFISETKGGFTLNLSKRIWYWVVKNKYNPTTHERYDHDVPPISTFIAWFNSEDKKQKHPLIVDLRDKFKKQKNKNNDV